MRIQVDEIWGYVGKKQRHLTKDDDPRQVGDMWTFVAIDPDSKAIPCYLVGKRTWRNYLHFGHYNFVRKHGTIRTTPAVAVGVADEPWTIGDLLDATT